MKKQYSLALTPVCCAIISVLATSQAIASANFSFGPTPDTQQPTLVFPGTTTRAYYTITNLTGSARNGYVIQKLPSTAVQNTTGSNCQSVINLPAHGTCTLQIDITGEVKTNIAICNGSSCTTASTPLNVSLSSSPQPMIAVGSFTGGGAGLSKPLPSILPLLAHSGDGGFNWDYPTTVLTELLTPVLATFSDGEFFTASCSGNNCVAAGDQAATIKTLLSGAAGSNSPYPLLAHSADGGVTWAYPTSVISGLPSDFSPNTYTLNYPPSVYAKNGFNSVGCNGSICVAGGSYKANSSNPYVKALLAQSTDGGGSWTYPDISVGAPVTYDAVFWGVSCSGNTCVAVGEDYDNNNFVPFLAQSTNGGAWTYPQSAITNNPNQGQTGHKSLSIFYGVSCSGSQCVAVGEYWSSTLVPNNLAPLLAQSADGGKNWTYPSSIINSFVPIYSTYTSQSNNKFTSVSCNNNVCIAAGYGEDGTLPLLAQSTNGVDWTYTISPQLSTDNLPLDIFAYHIGWFNSVSCGDTVCVAVGSYYNTVENQVPLLGQSFDNGVTWVYPPILTFPAGGSAGSFNSVSCSGTTCVASGQYTSGANTYPLLAQTTDNGTTWTYPPTVIGVSVLPSGFIAGSFNGSSVSSASLLPESLKFIHGGAKTTR